MAESNRAEHQHKVEETPSEAILRYNKLSCKCRGWRPRQPDFVCSIILAISAQFFLDNLADRCYNKKAENCEKSNKVCRGTQAKSWVEKVKPDPLNLLVNTSVGSKFCVNLPPAWSGGFFVSPFP